MTESEQDIKIALLEERIRSMETARTLQAAEYERRLKELNYAHATAEKVLATYLTKEAYDISHKEIEKRLTAHDVLFAELKGRIAAYTISIMVVWGIIQFVIRYWK